MMSAMPAQPQGTRGDESLPVLYGVQLDGARIAFDVVSSGCTEASHFSLRLDPEAPDTYRLSIIRHRQDRCRMAAHIVTLSLDVPTVANPAGANFLLVNRLAAPIALRRPDP